MSAVYFLDIFLLIRATNRPDKMGSVLLIATSAKTRELLYQVLGEICLRGGLFDGTNLHLHYMERKTTRTFHGLPYSKGTLTHDSSTSEDVIKATSTEQVRHSVYSDPVFTKISFKSEVKKPEPDLKNEVFVDVIEKIVVHFSKEVINYSMTKLLL
ncbi:uncharacterized protein [Parasteatoda tepidariorum]|uniref:uncharacterized protein n=1 Tax=Parasteatoda tepidariorum TaxID=114398 RepID=UPI0039BC3369